MLIILRIYYVLVMLNNCKQNDKPRGNSEVSIKTMIKKRVGKLTLFVPSMQVPKTVSQFFFMLWHVCICLWSKISEYIYTSVLLYCSLSSLLTTYHTFNLLSNIIILATYNAYHSKIHKYLILSVKR